MAASKREGDTIAGECEAQAAANQVAANEPPADKKDLDMTEDEMKEKNAFIWVCGRNDDGELGMGSKSEGLTLPKNIA